uniref:Interleukin-12 beta central domain-containing protein n=2 Tax=Gasterosteus aculeatus aculeatus TaxID=481459 RepID=G3QAY3_GASAC|nr:interleukin-12 subunit beta isoform X1 [Gasterosteus aculeatus aculeatus]
MRSLCRHAEHRRASHLICCPHRIITSTCSKMHALFLMVLCAGLWPVGSSSIEYSIEALMDNVLALKVRHGVATKASVPLSCGEAYENQRVLWKKNGEWINPPLEGNQVQVEVKEMDGGNYTCHLGPDGDYLNHTVILVQLESGHKIGQDILTEQSDIGHIHCSAYNYSSFHCTWKRSKLRESASVLLVRAERQSSYSEISCELDADGSGIHCQDASCPHKEEQHRIRLIVYIYIGYYLEVYTRLFYLRDIVRPDALPNLRGNKKEFSWSHPDSWEKPCTYFALQFQVKVVKKGLSCDSTEHIMLEETPETKYELNIKTKKYTFCVRAQDKHTQGPFSPWSFCTRANPKSQECVPT